MTRLELLKNEPFSLALASGYFGFFAHAGFVKALVSSGLMPQSVSGTSGGAVVAAALASGLSPSDICLICQNLKKEHFWVPQKGWGLVSGHKIEKIISEFSAENFSKTIMPLKISAFNIFKMKNEVLTEGSISLAAQASAAVPILFHPVKIGSSYYWDGGITDRPGLAGLKSDERLKVVHYFKSKDVVGRFEDRWFYKDIFNNPHLFSRTSPFKIGPDYLQNGSMIIEYYFQEGLSWLGEQV